MKNENFYNLSNDHLFKEVFRKEENLKILLQDFFGITVSKIVYKNGETLKKNKKDKYGVIDILMEINDDINCIMEMQSYYRIDFKNRLVTYASIVTSDEGLKEGETYDKLKTTKVLALVNFSNEEYKNSIEARLKDQNNNIFSEAIGFNIVNINEYKDKTNPLYKMLTCESLDEIEGYKNDKVYGPIYEKIKYYNLNEKERRKMDRLAQIIEEEKTNYDVVAKYARLEGIQQGIKEGLQQGLEEGKSIGFADGKKAGMKVGIKTGEINGKKIEKLEIAKNMLIENFDIGIVSKITKVPTKELKKLQKAL